MKAPSTTTSSADANWHAGDGMKAAVATATAAEGSGLLATKN